MGDAVWGAAANAAVGIGSAVMASNQASKQEDYMQEVINQGQGNRDLIEGIDKYFLGGGRASELNVPGFADQFGQLDFMRQEQEQAVEKQAREARQMIEDTMPSGGAKLRALADLSIKAQDAKNKVSREYEAKKNDLDIQLTNSYMQGAMGRQSGVSPNTQYAYGMQGLQGSQNLMSGIGQSLGQLAGQLGKDKKDTDIEVTPKKGYGYDPVSPYSTLYNSRKGSDSIWGSGSAWDGLDDYGLE